MVKGKHKLHVRNLRPSDKALPNGQRVPEPEIEELGPKLAFYALDLYTTRFGKVLNDDVETFLFGPIDKTGADAVRAWISGNPNQIHRRFQDFFNYMDAQKLRTPKGLDWILKRYHGLPQMELMVQMQALRQMHCTMWSECVREIVSAAKSSVKFLVSDHPVTAFHPKLDPTADECRYPDDPGVQLVSTQTIFVLDANHCLILTNLEYAEDPEAADHMARRTNARFRGESMARTNAMLRGRELTEAEVLAINFVLLSRAKQFVAAGRSEWLYPEQHCRLSWDEIAGILLPRDSLWGFGGDVYIGYADGSTAYRDKFGRTSKAHEFLAKPPLTAPLEPDDPCGCGGGLKFRDCCQDIAASRRPSWRTMSIRERNLALIRGISNILQLDGSDAAWLHVRRTLSADQVSRIHKLHAALWPTDTQLVDLLPSPQSKRSRALYLGPLDARTLSESITGMLAYVDELVVVHPFLHADTLRKEFSPVFHPSSHREQTLRNVFTLMVLEGAIQAGRVHLIPDPLDFDLGYREEIKAIVDRQGNTKLGPRDEALSRALARDEMMRVVKRLPPDQMKAYIKARAPAGSGDVTDTDIDAVVKNWSTEAEGDPLTLLTPLPADPEGEYRIMKSFSRETGLYVATLTGAFVYTDSDTQWLRLHETDGVHGYEPDSTATEIVSRLGAVQIKMPTLTYHHASEPEGAGETRAALRDIARALRTGETLNLRAAAPDSSAATPSADEELLTCSLRASVPEGGFQRTDVTRLVLTFGRLDDVAPVGLALFVEPLSASSP